MWYCLILLFSCSMDRSHLPWGSQKIYIFQNFQKLTKLWSVKLSLGWELEKWCIIFRNNKPLSPFVAHFSLLRHAMHVTPTQKVRHFAPLDVLFPTVCHT
jgi:hypothetical protein